MNKINRFISIEVILALLIIVAYFLPWIDFGIVKQIGWEIPKLQKKITQASNLFSRNKSFIYTSYAILLLPLISVIIIALWGMLKHKAARALLFISGILGTALAIYLFFSLPKHGSSGVYLLFLASSLSAIYCIIIRKRERRIKNVD